MSSNNYLKDSPVDGIVVTFTVQNESDGIFKIKYIQTSRLSNRQQLEAGSKVLKIVGAFMAHAGSDDYLRISARSYLRAMGLVAPRQTAQAPVDLRIDGGFVIVFGGIVDGFANRSLL